MPSYSAAQLVETRDDFPVVRRRSPVSGDLVTAPADFVAWQTDIVAILQRDFGELLADVTVDDIDWAAWRSLFVAGKSARAAVERALELDL